MRRSAGLALAALALVFGFVAGAAAKAKKSAPPDLAGSPAEVGDRLLQAALAVDDVGTWEEIGVARVHYLAGHKEAAQARFDAIAAKNDPGDLIRIARVYAQAGEWDKARPLFDRVVVLAPDDADWLAEVGAYYNLHGDRARAEELFRRSFQKEASNLNYRKAAASYLGVEPG